jgi:hypothetical protein
MGWSNLGTQFCLELAFGVLVALAFVPKAPVGAFFYRIMGTTALVPILCAAILPVAAGGASLSRPAVLAAGLAALCYPIYAGPFRGLRWGLGLALGIAGCGTALVLQVGEAGLLAGEVDLPRRVLASASVLATGAVAGGVGLAMVLGHWYLTVPKLEVRHLTRLNRLTMAFMALSAVLLALTCLAFAGPLSEGRTPISSPFGLFYLGTRVVVGLAMPLLFAWMAAQSLRYRNTRSATGILYASTVLVLIGAAASIAMQDAYGVPL